ncbi:DNA-binding protein [Paracoccus sp. Z118]|uniref:PPC domain-containing DNA-binding protein n=1 Tax=Paracoccus sp. Z118 TaxID=2851017 RepID=UPI001C2BBAB9|nr:PPC domain-containing DNA-binding protein [Paracoccus sp. Z118]MBV0891381.1 DNA-binding protein [Paracoccus sp. Z118]
MPIGAALAALSSGVFAAARLLPGDDLIGGLRRVQQDAGAEAMAVLTCAGSLRTARIRHADADEGTLYEGRFEIVSLTGTLDPRHQHLHIAISDGAGRVFGGHLLPGSEVRTTAEIVALILPDLAFDRAVCERSGFHELTITNRKAEA